MRVFTRENVTAVAGSGADAPMSSRYMVLSGSVRPAQLAERRERDLNSYDRIDYTARAHYNLENPHKSCAILRKNAKSIAFVFVKIGQFSNMFQQSASHYFFDDHHEGNILV